MFLKVFLFFLGIINISKGRVVVRMRRTLADLNEIDVTPEKYSEEYSNRLVWNELKPEEFKKMIGAKVVGVNTIGYPFKEGIVLYMKSKDDEDFVVSFTYTDDEYTMIESLIAEG